MDDTSWVNCWRMSAEVSAQRFGVLSLRRLSYQRKE